MHGTTVKINFRCYFHQSWPSHFFCGCVCNSFQHASQIY